MYARKRLPRATVVIWIVVYTFVYVELTEGEGVCRVQAEDEWDIYIYERVLGSEMGLVV